MLAGFFLLAGCSSPAPASKSSSPGPTLAAVLAATQPGDWRRLDPENTLAFFYNAGELPTSVLYDAQGREVWRMVGAHDWSGKDSAALIAPAMP